MIPVVRVWLCVVLCARLFSDRSTVRPLGLLPYGDLTRHCAWQCLGTGACATCARLGSCVWDTARVVMPSAICRLLVSCYSQFESCTQCTHTCMERKEKKASFPLILQIVILGLADGGSVQQCTSFGLNCACVAGLNFCAH